MTGTPTWLRSRRGAATLATAALLLGGVGLAPAVSSMAAPTAQASHLVFTGCLTTSGARVVTHVVRRRGVARHHECPPGSIRVHWNAKGRRGADGAAGAQGSAGADGGPGANGATGATGRAGVDGVAGPAGLDGAPGTNGVDGTPGTNGVDGAVGLPGADGSPGADGADGAAGADGADGVDGADGAAGADGADGADGATGPAGPGSLVSSGVFTLVSDGPYPDTNAYLPLTGYLGTPVVADPPVDFQAEFIEAPHTSVEQVIAENVTITNMYLNFASSTDLQGHRLRVEVTLLASSGGTIPLVPVGSCMFDVVENGATSHDCAWSNPGEVAHLNAGDVAVLYVHPYVNNWEPNSPVQIYGSVAMTVEPSTP